MRVSGNTVLEAALEWAKAERYAEDCAAESNAVVYAIQCDRASGRALLSDVLLRRAQEALRRACRDADNADHMMRELAMALEAG